jgi:hypothetical protein
MMRLVRPFAALVAIFGLVFAQLATAAYACPQLAKAAKAGTIESHGGCDHGASTDPSLCQHHCDDGKASVEKPKTFVPPAISESFAYAIETLLVPSRVRTGRCLQQASTGPPLTRFTVLRI